MNVTVLAIEDMKNGRTYGPGTHSTGNWRSGPSAGSWKTQVKQSSVTLEIFPFHLSFQGSRIIAATSKAWIVDASFRGYSFLLLSHFFRQSQVQLFINNTVNEQAVKGYEAFRVRRVPVGAWDQSVFWITNYRGFAASVLSAGKSLIPKQLRFAVSLGLLAQDKLTTGRSKWRSSSVSPVFVSSFDRRFERFWQVLQCSRSNVLLAVRSPQILDWHFHRALAERRAWVLAVTEKSELVAYAIFLRRDNRAFGLRRLRLIDFQSCEGKDELLAPILSAALRQCHIEGVDMLEVVGLRPSQLNVLDRRGLRRRVLPSWMYFYKTNDRHLAKAFEAPSHGSRRVLMEMPVLELKYRLRT